MHRFTLSLILGCAPLVALAIDAADPPQKPCSALPTAAERIVCYDTQFPPDHSTDTPASPPGSVADVASNPAPSPSTSVPPQSASASPQSASEQLPTQVASPRNDDREPWTRELFARSAPVHEQSTIKAIRRRESQNMVFVLANEQIWLQDSQRLLPFRVGDAVTITNGTIGGYFLTSDGGTKTRVRRIK